MNTTHKPTKNKAPGAKGSTGAKRPAKRPAKLTVKLLTYKGQTLSVADWAKKLGLKPNTIRGRLNRLGWSVEKTLSTPADS